MKSGDASGRTGGANEGGNMAAGTRPSTGACERSVWEVVEAYNVEHACANGG